jgi:hypothetical protein
MTEPKRKRGRPRKEEAALHQIAITSKRVHAGDGRKWERGQRLFVGEDVTLELAVKFLKLGHAIILDGKTLEESEQARRDAEAVRMIYLQKSRADNVMARHDMISEDERLRAHEEHEYGELK